MAIKTKRERERERERENYFDFNGDFFAVQQVNSTRYGAAASEERRSRARVLLGGRSGNCGGGGGGGRDNVGGLGGGRPGARQLEVDGPVEPGRRRRVVPVGDRVFTDGSHVSAVLRPLLATPAPLGLVLLDLHYRRRRRGRRNASTSGARRFADRGPG